jgi:DNA gyrase/topoisomerase IV subunit A
VSERNRRDRYLLVVTEDGFAKRLPVAELPPRRRAAKGVCVSSVPLAAALEVGAGDEVVLASALGKVERVAVTEVPLRRRRVLSAGQMFGRALLGLAEEDVGALIAGIRTLERDELQAVVASWLLEGDVLVFMDADEAAGEKADDDAR